MLWTLRVAQLKCPKAGPPVKPEPKAALLPHTSCSHLFSKALLSASGSSCGLISLSSDTGGFFPRFLQLTRLSLQLLLIVLPGHSLLHSAFLRCLAAFVQLLNSPLRCSVLLLQASDFPSFGLQLAPQLLYLPLHVIRSKLPQKFPPAQLRVL